MYYYFKTKDALVQAVVEAHQAEARTMLAAIDELVRSRGLMLIAGSFNLAAGLAIVLGHNVWSGGALTIDSGASLTTASAPC